MQWKVTEPEQYLFRFPRDAKDEFAADLITFVSRTVMNRLVGDYSFDEPLKRGDKLVFSDMALYSIVKSTTFNGINLPDIAVMRDGGRIETVKRFGYKEYKARQS